MLPRSQLIGYSEIRPLDERRAARRTIGAVEATSILNANSNWQFYFSIKEIAEYSELWFAHRADGSLIEFKSNDRWVAPFWPHEDVAALACKKMNVTGEINPMPVDYWIDNVIDGTCREYNLLIALCPTAEGAFLTTVDDVLEALSAYKVDPDAYWQKHFAGDTITLRQNMKAGPKSKLP
jgi:Protein of unknown function (DUF2750)